MKKFYFSLGKWFISAGVVLLPAWALANTNEIQMESYFPTPYVTYNNVFVSQQFDVGTSKGPFTLSLGSNRGNPTPSLQIDPIPFRNNSLQPDGTANAFAHLKTTPEDGPTLSFGNVQMRSRAVRFGSPTDQVDNAEMTFGNLRIVTLSNMKAKPVQEINATSVQVDKQMYLMEDRFANAALPGCEKTVSWQKLTLGSGSEAWYLVCGDPVEGGGGNPPGGCAWRRVDAKDCYPIDNFGNEITAEAGVTWCGQQTNWNIGCHWNIRCLGNTRDGSTDPGAFASTDEGGYGAFIRGLWIGIGFNGKCLLNSVGVGNYDDVSSTDCNQNNVGAYVGEMVGDEELSGHCNIYQCQCQ